MPKKVFELAKELGVGPLDLVEKLRESGLTVRNHMSSLSDEELGQVSSIFAKEASETQKTKKTKKKTTRKKKAVTVKKTAAVSESEETPKKSTVVKKKTVIRKKQSSEKVKAPAVEEAPVETQLDISPPQEETTVVEAAVIETQVAEIGPPQEVEEKKEVTPAESDSSPKEVVAEEREETPPPEVEQKPSFDSPTGLRVVSKPKEKPQEEVISKPDEKPKEEEKPKGNGKVYYEEKVHRFTPVYTPPPKEEKEPQGVETRTEASGPAREGDKEKGKEESKGDTSKKRLGGLASMMSGKKGTMTRSQVLQQTRADTEMKSYAALSSLGRPLYTTVKRKKQFHGSGASTEITEVKESKRVIHIHKGCTAKELAQKLKTKFNDFADKVLDMNLLLKEEDYLGKGLIEELAALYQFRVEDKAFDEDKVLGNTDLSEEDKEKLPLRDPIIAIMGHVDHGKTTLLDYIRNAKVAAGEAGGITQHIGAYSVDVKGKKLTFLDTPGHAAFASMRQRGADVTDIVILIVAADDGVMPQTRESIKFCQQANKPVIVAINKMDREGANPDRIKTALSEFGITPEDWGGDNQFVPISALKGDGIDDLLEAIALQAEVLELRADPKGKAKGVVIESKVEQGRGPVATVLVESGTLKKGDSLVVGESFGRARSLTNHMGKLVPKAGPSTPIQILGLDAPPSPGDLLDVVKNEREAKKVVANRVNERKSLEQAPKKVKVSLEDFFSQAPAQTGETKTLSLLVRADVNGSFEAIKQSLTSLSNKEVEIKFVGGGVGPITDSDVELAASAEGIIIGFNMRPMTSARKMSETKGVEVKTYSIIYELINDVKLAIEGLLEPNFEEKYIGRAEVKETFSTPKAGTIAGSMVIDGKIAVGCNIRLLRQGKILFDGKLSSLRRFKDDVKEVKNGIECGIGLENYNDIKIGDLFEAYLMEEKKRTLEDVEKEEQALNLAKAESSQGAESRP